MKLGIDPISTGIARFSGFWDHIALVTRHQVHFGAQSVFANTV